MPSDHPPDPKYSTFHERGARSCRGPSRVGPGPRHVTIAIDSAGIKPAICRL
jgi:hypothetical protein